MKYCKIILIAVLLTMVGRTYADNLKVANVELKAGETKEMAIELNNPSKKYTAFQFDLVLPDGISIAKNNKGKLIASLDADRMDDHTLNVEDMGSNTYRFLTFSMTCAVLVSWTANANGSPSCLPATRIKASTANV